MIIERRTPINKEYKYIVKSVSSTGTIYQFETEKEAKEKAEELSKIGKDILIYKLEYLVKPSKPIFEKI